MAGICNLLCLITIAVAFNTVTATNYCNVGSCSDKPSHTMCKFSSPTPAKACTQAKSVGLTPEEKRDIVNRHNELRRKVASGQETKGNPGPQPAAVSMPDLTWDNELEAVAQRWANQCNYAHDKCRNVDRFAVGQNIAATYYSNENNSPVTGMVQSWYDEVAKFNRNGVDKYVFDSATAHYTQVIWANTNKIGCGRIKYRSGNWNAQYLVCNYGPAGNYIGQRIYQRK